MKDHPSSDPKITADYCTTVQVLSLNMRLLRKQQHYSADTHFIPVFLPDIKVLHIWTEDKYGSNVVPQVAAPAST